MTVRKCAGLELTVQPPRLGERVDMQQASFKGVNFSVNVAASGSVGIGSSPLSRRFGSFEITQDMLLSGSPDIDVLRAIFDGVFVLKTDYSFCTGRITYEAISADFDVVPLGDVAPLYIGIIHSNLDPKTDKRTVRRTWEKARP